SLSCSSRYVDHCHIHSFPTRRSSDLSSHAGTPVTGTDSIAAPASPASRPAQAGTPVTGTDGIQSGEASDPSEVIRATTGNDGAVDRKSTRLNSSHVSISYAVFCL